MVLTIEISVGQDQERSKQVGFFKKEARRGQHHYVQIVYKL